MSYTKKTWTTGNTITASALNNLETGVSDNASAIADIEAALPTYVGEKVTRKAAATITPGTVDQTISSNQYLTGAQTIKGDANLTAGNIKKDISIFGVTGTLETGSTETDKTGTGTYIWEKRDEKIWWVESKGSSTSSKPSGYGTTEYKFRTITDDGYYSLGNSSSGTISFNTYYLPTGATNGKTKTVLYKPYSAYGSSYYVCTLSDEKEKTGKKGDTILGYISADSESAYPNSGLQDDVFYTLINTPDVDVTAAKMLDGTVACGQSGKVTGTISKKASATITPGTADQTISSGQYLSGTQTIKGDENLIAENIKSGVSIFGVAGTLEAGSTGTDTSDATASASDILSGKTAYVNGEKVTGTITPKAAGAYTPKTTDQIIPAGYYLKGDQTIKGDTNLIAGNIKKGTSIFGVTGTLETGTDTSDATASASDILSGKTAYVNGAKVTGTISKKTSASYTPSTSDQIISSGQYLAGPQTVKGDANLVAANIKKGVSIFGVTGTLESDGTDGTSLNNCEAYLITSTSQAVNFKNTGGTIKVWGYATQTSSSSWGGTTTKLLAFDGDKYYTSVSYGSPTATSLSLSLNSDGTISGLPTLASCSLLVTMGV